MDVTRRDLEEAFARYGQFKSFDYATGDPAAIVTYNDIEEAIKARAKLTGVTQIADGRKVRSESSQSDSSRRGKNRESIFDQATTCSSLHPAGLRIDYLDRPTARRFVIVRPQDNTSKRRSSSTSSKGRPRSISPDEHREKDNDEDLKRVSSVSRSPSPVAVRKQRSPSPPVPGRSFHGPLGSYLSSNETSDITSIDELIILCEKLNERSPTVYPVQFFLKSHAYPTRMHFLAGNPTLTNQILGKHSRLSSRVLIRRSFDLGPPGDEKKLKLTQRLRLDQHRLDDLEKKLRSSVSTALGSRKPNIANLTRFSILVTSTKAHDEQWKSNGKMESPRDENDESSLSRFISYLAEYVDAFLSVSVRFSIVFVF